MIKVLSKDTIDKIAAGEVIERPASVVKELVENSIDAGARAITVEIKNGGIDLIRITDNGHGIESSDIPTAFLRHATGKITDAADLLSIHTLGFRGEALSSIAAVTRTELITKTADSITGVRYVIEGGNEISAEEVGAPDGTTIIVRDIFFNVPARKKFLKTASTEGSHIAELIQKLALSHPQISFRFINSGQTRLCTSGNGRIEDIVYQIYGRDITALLLKAEHHEQAVSVSGLIGKPEVSRPNRNFENFFINGRYVRSSIISKAIEDAYEERLMQHQFPFAVLMIDLDPASIDVNVHPTKMEVRFSKSFELYELIKQIIKNVLEQSILIPHTSLDTGAEHKQTDAAPRVHVSAPEYRPEEPFETGRTLQRAVDPDGTHLPGNTEAAPAHVFSDDSTGGEQMTFSSGMLSGPGPCFRIAGQFFATYWVIEYDGKMIIMDQHAAHEKIYYERMLKQFRSSAVTSQYLDPPIIVTLSDSEADILTDSYESFASAGFEIEHFGGNEYAVRAIPDSLPSVNKAELLKEMISDASEEMSGKSSTDRALCILEKTASMACKAAVKGGQMLSAKEAEILFRELIGCDDPYCCPHGRPTMIGFTKADIEKRFKRIV